MQKLLPFCILLTFLFQGLDSKINLSTPSALRQAIQSGNHRESGLKQIPVIFDTDANNELDDQHALAYLLFNGETFDLAGVTVNATRSGGPIDDHYAEAERVMKLSGFDGTLPLYKGANGSFEAIRNAKGTGSFDGSQAVNFMVAESRKPHAQKPVIIAVGKLTNVALALKLEPALADKMKLVWLGSNYPDPGEYNLDNDTASLNYVLRTNIEFEVVTVRYGKPSGSDAVRITQTEVNQNMRGKGPRIVTPVSGRHGGSFSTFGDYSISLFENIQYHGNPPSRALFDMVAVAVVKNPSWGKKMKIPAPKLVNNLWVDQPGNPRAITIWENFDKEAILVDFYRTMDHYLLVKTIR